MAAEGWSRGADGLLQKKYDPHAAARAARYEADLREHQSRRPRGGQQQYASNNPATAASRGQAAREKAAANREDKVARARKFNERNEKKVLARHAMAESHRETASYMEEFHDALGLAKPQPPQSSSSNAPQRWRRSRLSSRDRSAGLDARRWRAGPADPSGELVDASDRPLLCVSVSSDGRDAVVGSADHACYGVEVPGGSPRRMYSKSDGHSDWVTAVAHVPGTPNEVLSAGMDGRLYRWRGARCARELAPAGPSISALIVDETAPLALAAAYDGAARLWSLTTNAELAQLANARPGATSCAPILSACWRENVVVCGDRDGRATAYDAATAECLATWAPRACGHVVSVASLSRATFATGTQDGRVRVWDPKHERPVADLAAHVGPDGAGAVGAIEELDDGVLFASMGADKAVKVFDLRSPRAPLRDFRTHDDFPHCLTTLGHFVVSGAADGALLCHDVKTGDCCWGLGANRGAVRAVDARPDALIAVGDDGNALLWDFSSS
ncbi:hypothetical protein CTAYLR_001792 [Chrysophaeum taylorii]|uniref:Uncharacterized protein n=1 Tax=Chrysophaeum taylorii TaxID=2483200 RepID=A0AAD7UH84_9STRA|nr:hypothetical protein CTAYLR_001792 [Chrysophaeum taylorii]